MPEDDFYTPTDVDALRMENELLAFEVSFLKARLFGTEKLLGSSHNSLSRVSHMEEAEQDLILLLRRLGSSPLAPLLRWRGNFRTLEERYLNTPEGQGSAERVAHLEAAEKDLVLLLQRLVRPPFGPLFRRRKSIRTLEERYL